MNEDVREWSGAVRRAIGAAVPAAVPIASLEVVSIDGSPVVRARGDGGGEGYVPANARIPDTLSLVKRRVFPFFLGRDARDIAWLAELCFASNSTYKYAGVGLWNAIAHVELAVLDLLGRSAGLPVADWFGGRRRGLVPVYLSSTTRASDPADELERIASRLAETGARACKFKIGGRMSGDEEADPQRSRLLIERARAVLGDEVAIYVDANSSYTVEQAIEVGRRLEAHGIDLYEEPVHFQDFEGTKRVADALSIDVSGGEQCSDEYLFRWMFRHHGVDVVQPDVCYAGGLSRTLRIARLAEAAGCPVTPHSPRTGFGQAPNLHLISLLERPGAYHEHHIRALERHQWVTPEPDVHDGELAVPDGPGLGLEYDRAALEAADIILRSEETP